MLHSSQFPLKGFARCTALEASAAIALPSPWMKAMQAIPQQDNASEPGYVSTGHLPRPELVAGWVAEAHRRFRSNTEGKNSNVYPALERVPSDLFGVCVVATSGDFAA